MNKQINENGVKLNRYIAGLIALLCLCRPDNKEILSTVCALSLLVVCIATALKTRDTWIQICFFSGALGVYSYNSAMGSLLLPYLSHGTIRQYVQVDFLSYIMLCSI